MLWLALFLPQLSLEALGGGHAFHAVTERRGARRWVVAASDECVLPGTDWGAVQVLHPEFQALERKPRAERQAMAALGAWAYRYGSELIWDIVENEIDYGLPQPLLWIEIGASLKLFGGLEPLLADFDAGIKETGHFGRRGVAPTIEAAALLARAGIGLPVVVERAHLAARLSDLPLHALALPRSIFDALKNIGLSRIGELLALPADALGRRHGPMLSDHLDRLLGRRPDVRPRWRLPPHWQRRFDLLGDVEHTEGLLFPLQRMTRELAEYLRARDTGVQEFQLTMKHGRASGGRVQEDSVFDLRLAAPNRDAERFMRVLREHLARTPLPAPVRSLRLQARAFVDTALGQRDLFDDTAGTDEAWGQLTEKLIARLGADAVVSLGLVADHRPERSWRALACDAPPPLPMLPAGTPPRPIWLIDPPKPLSAKPQLLEGLERIEGGWWDGEDAKRDYYRADLNGGRLWVYQDRKNSGWFLHGIWA